MRTIKTLLTAAVATAGLGIATPAFAGCDPSCGEDEVCRYEAAGGKFYCQKSKTSGNAKLKGLGNRSVERMQSDRIRN